MRKILPAFLALLLLLGVLASCGDTAAKPAKDRPLVVATNFVLYDVARSLAGNLADVRMLLAPGAEAHEYELTLADAALIAEADLFLYVGGESEDWADDLFASMREEDRPASLRAMDAAILYEEQTVEGMQTEPEGTHGAGEEEGEIDEHVWTSFENLRRIAAGTGEKLTETLPGEKERLGNNLAAYREQIDRLERDYRAMIERAARRTIVVADRFPFLYLAKELDLDYFAAFSGCSSNVEASLSTIHFLVSKVRDEGIPAVFVVELSDGKCAEAVARETGCGVLTLYSGHTTTPEEFEAGVTYFDLLARNLEALGTALN